MSFDSLKERNNEIGRTAKGFCPTKTRLIDHLYISHMPLCCPNEANCNGVDVVDISDITTLIDYLYIDHSPTAVCP